MFIAKYVKNKNNKKKKNNLLIIKGTYVYLHGEYWKKKQKKKLLYGKLKLNDSMGKHVL